MKPRVFIGSSTEALEVAYAIQESLEHDALCKVWTQGIFDLSGSALDNLLAASFDFDFAVFVFQPDDITKIRTDTVKTVRDNVIFELGLFVSRLGKDKVYFLVPAKSEGMHLPTDLLGITPGSYVPPEKKEDLLATLGPFCNKVRRQMKDLFADQSKPASSNSSTASKESPRPDEQIDKIVEKAEAAEVPLKKIENGVMVDEFGNFKLSIAPTVFFDYRICNSFPGIRGLHWLTNPKDALDRLQILLREPIAFERANGYGTDTEPIWLWRGHLSWPLKHFLRSSQTRCLLDIYELELDRVAVWKSRSYHHSFLYVEVRPDQPVGIYKRTDDELHEMVSVLGYAVEEYGLYKDTPITLACYNDGAALINGEIVDVSGAVRRVRYLSKYNFLIASKYSPINSPEFGQLSEPLLNKMLAGENHIDQLCKIVDQLPRFRLS